MDFVKMEGLGNDFVVVTGPVDLDPATITAWCRRRTGIGADGVLSVTRIDRSRVDMRYWNADGGEAEMCGNGLRCVAILAREEGWVDGEAFVVGSAVGVHPVRVLGPESARVFVGRPHRFRTERLVVAEHEVRPVGVGNPHAVLFVDAVGEAPVVEVGPRIERDPLFPDGTNVEFVEVLDDHRIAVRVWERGVGETPASGTGATAAAFAAADRGLVASPVTVVLSGGELTVELEGAGAWIAGPARIVYRGRITD